MAEPFFTRLESRCAQIDSLLCVGLDPRVKLPANAEMSDIMECIVETNKRLIEATVDYAACYKPNIAFYEAFGVQGLEALAITLALIPGEVPVILDAKRGDIGATAEAYARAVFETWGADAVTVSPYMGRDSVEPFLAYEDRAVFVLCRTSNPGNRDFQDIRCPDGRRLYTAVADTALAWNENRVGLVVAANDTEALCSLRARHPRAWFLAPGIGTQGGEIGEAIRYGLSGSGAGILPVVARGISGAENPAEAARRYRDEINDARTKKTVHGADIEPTHSCAEEDLKTRVLTGLVENHCFRMGEFTLKSGEKSPFYIDLRLIISDPGLLRLCAKAYASVLERPGMAGYRFDRIAGIPTAGLPLAAAVSLETGIPMLFPRMNAKGHGTGRMIEGDYREGERVLLLDDLITTGASKLEAIDILRSGGLKVEHLTVLLERGAQGRRDMEAAGVRLEAFAHVSEFFPLLERSGVISAEDRKRLEEYASR